MEQGSQFDVKEKFQIQLKSGADLQDPGIRGALDPSNAVFLNSPSTLATTCASLLFTFDKKSKNPYSSTMKKRTFPLLALTVLILSVTLKSQVLPFEILGLKDGIPQSQVKRAGRQGPATETTKTTGENSFG